MVLNRLSEKTRFSPTFHQLPTNNVGFTRTKCQHIRVRTTLKDSIRGYKEQTEQHLKKSGGIITFSYCREHKISTVYLTGLVRQGVLTLVDEGIYFRKKKS